MKKFYIIFLFILPLFLFSQGENDNWYFGNKAALNFSGSTPAALFDSQMFQHEAVGTVSDSNGNLLFYTNGQSVWNKDHQIMQNGTGLFGNDSSAQLAISKHPGNPNQYFIFTTGVNYAPGSNLVGNPISYSIVDMSQGNLDAFGNPLGKILDNKKNLPIYNKHKELFRGEAITVVAGANNDYWVLIPFENDLYSYNINNSGFNVSLPKCWTTYYTLILYCKTIKYFIMFLVLVDFVVKEKTLRWNSALASFPFSTNTELERDFSNFRAVFHCCNVLSIPR